MSKRIPRWISEQYRGGSHEFRALKRRQVRAALKAIQALRRGCAYFPNGTRSLEIAAANLETVKADISVKNWGR